MPTKTPPYGPLETAITGLANSATAGMRPNEVAGLQTRLDQALAETYGVHGDRSTYQTLRMRLWQIGDAEIPRERFGGQHPAQRYRGLLLRGAAYVTLGALFQVGSEYALRRVGGLDELARVHFPNVPPTLVEFGPLIFTLFIAAATEFLLWARRKAKK